MDSVGYLFLDVDGPLNPWAEKGCRRPVGYTTHRLRPAGWENARKPLRVWLNPSHGPALVKLAADTGLTLAWATTWQFEANRLIGPVLGLPELPVVDFDHHPGSLKDWKFPAVADFASGKPLVWFDDDFRSSRLVHTVTDFQHQRGDLPTLLHWVDPRVGLTEADFDAVRRWVAVHQPA